MVEYGGVVSQSTGAGAGASGGGSLLDFAGDLVNRFTSLPPEVMLVAAAMIIVGALVLRRAT
jgi:hypothetical protein